MARRDGRSPNWGMGILFLTALVLAISCASGPTSSPVCLAGAQLDSRGRCQAQSAPRHHLPFRVDTEVRVTQGFHGYTSHRDDLAYAVDFACEEGTPITASRSGVVWAARDDSNRGCPSEACVDDANYIILDHGDGTYSSYFHLQHKGAIVEPGEQVCQGQVIGLCGNTGFSTGPHLHFSVMNMQRTSIPVTFVEAGRNGAGLVLPGETYRSQNRRGSRCGPIEYSQISPDAFVHRGIMLRRPLPTIINGHARHRRMVVEGTYAGTRTHVAIHRRASGSAHWYEQCVEVDERGRFAFEAAWPTLEFSPGYYFLMLTGSDADCSAPGWAWSYRIRVD